MRSSLRVSLAAVAASVFAFAAMAGAAAQQDNPPPEQRWMQRWTTDHEAMLNAKLAGLKAGLGLNPDQEKLWGPFEAAVRDLAQMHMQHMMRRMEMTRGMHRPDMAPGADRGPEMGEEEGGSGSPVDRLEAMADRLSEAGAAMKKVADAGKPLYESLDDSQKRIFGMLGREMMMLGHAHGDMMGRDRGPPGWGGPHRPWHEGPDDEE